MQPSLSRRSWLVAAAPAAAAAVVAAALSACAAEPADTPPTAGGSTSTPSPVTSPGTSTATGSPTSVPTTAPTTTVTTAPSATWPAYASTVAPVTTEQLGPTWREGCPVAPDALRLVTVTYVGFDGRPATGELVVNATVVDAVVAAFGDLYSARFPINKMITMDAYGGDDEASGADDNTSGFNCRNVLGTDRWSQHAYGLAIDLNPLENPYLVGGEVLPPAGSAYLDRTDIRPGMIVEGDVVFEAFTSRGFEWGGYFRDTPDYQHFALPR